MVEWRNGGIADVMAEWCNGGMAEWQNSENSLNSGNCGNFSLLCAQNVEDYCMGVWVVWEEK